MTEQSECLLSILIPTLEVRKTLCERLCSDLDQQIAETNTSGIVEVLTQPDDGTAPVGAKRNQLISKARGKFVVFVDDDDSVSTDYVRQIVRQIGGNAQADCISFAAEISFRGKHPRKMVHSIKHAEWHYSNGEYLRPPCHITPIRREIAASYEFAEVDFAEDMDWTLRMSRDHALEQEVMLDEVLYFYKCRRFFAYQWMLDRTQVLRHALGLRFADGDTLRKKPAWRKR